MSTISSQPYKGTRDFYPLELQKRNYIFDTWRKTLISHGFVEYDASILENAEIYIAKSGEELGGSQLYNFHDKGDRFVALRPEMTPTLARIVANKFGELRFPLRWFSIANFFRYERPQKGREREFWQLNVDVIGSEPGAVELEILFLAGEIFKAFGAKKEQYKIMFNHRAVLDTWLEKNQLINRKELIYKVLDDWFKLSVEENKQKLSLELNTEEIQKIVDITQKTGDNWAQYVEIAHTFPEIKLVLETIHSIQPDVEYEFTCTIIRGIAYYTGLVMEAFDKNPANSRAMFGGGRYDNLLDLFGKSAPAIGFAPGDVTWSEFLTNWNLWPDFSTHETRVGIMPFSEADLEQIYTQIIPALKTEGKTFEIDYDFSRSENKRWETLKKRGCGEIIKLTNNPS
jgi:histidyl-tRNA synthetase